MNADVGKARRLIAAVSLANVRLLEASAKTRIRLADLTDDMHPQYTHFARASSARLEDGVFYVIAALELKILSDSQDEGVATLKVQFELEYRLPSDFKPSRAEVNAFAKVNGIFNAWPYFREFVQSMSQKMDLPVIILPVYRVPQPPRPTVEAVAPSST